jgi:hypothetical protein
MGICLAMFVFLFKDTFRRERSLTYQAVLLHHLEHERRARHAQHSSERSSTMTVVEQRPVVNNTSAPGLGKDRHDTPNSDAKPTAPETDVEAAKTAIVPPPIQDIRVTLADVNPLPPVWMILCRWNNVATLFASGKLP